MKNAHFRRFCLFFLHLERAGERRESHSIGNTREEAGNVGPMCNIGSRRRRRGNCRESRTNGGSLSLSGSLLKEKGISLVSGCWSREEELLYQEHTPAAQFRVDGPSLPFFSPLARTEQEMRDGMRKEVRGRRSSFVLWSLLVQPPS